MTLDVLQLLARVYEAEPAALLLPPAEADMAAALRQAYAVMRRADPAAVAAWLKTGESLAPARDSDGQDTPTGSGFAPRPAIECGAAAAF